jgi:uncharacterized cupin superfamily protein
MTTATTCAALMPPAQYQQPPPSSNSNKKRTAGSATATTPPPPPPPCTLFFSHAPKSYFAIDNLTLQGTAHGQQPTPQHASRQLVIQGASSPAAFQTALSKTTVGSWWCSTGSAWTVGQPRTSTMVFHVWSGHAHVIDAAAAAGNGGDDNNETTAQQHFFGPGDTVILPKGWTGRWNVQQDIHTVWFDYEHEIDIQLQQDSGSSSPIVRAIVTRYHAFAPHWLQAQGVLQQQTDAAESSPPPRIALRIIHDKTPILKVGCWTCTPGSFMIQHHATTECFHVLEGVLFLTNHNADGMASRRCVAGDTVVIPKGWTGHVDVIQTVKKLWFAVD